MTARSYTRSNPPDEGALLRVGLAADAFDRFRQEFGDDYQRLDAALEGLASCETRVGLFGTGS